jgi:hypothetical protein
MLVAETFIFERVEAVVVVVEVLLTLQKSFWQEKALRHPFHPRHFYSQRLSPERSVKLLEEPVGFGNS